MLRMLLLPVRVLVWLALMQVSAVAVFVLLGVDLLLWQALHARPIVPFTPGKLTLATMDAVLRLERRLLD